MKCSAFWKHTNIRSGNRVYPCCRFKHAIDTFDGDLSAVLYSDSYQKLRTQSSNNQKISGCEKCYFEESIGHKSLRLRLNESYNCDSINLEFLEIGFDNLCNLTCDGCNSEFSTSWIIKEKQIYGKSKNKLMEIDEVTYVPDSLKKILFLGGEPLITNRHLKLLRQVKNKNKLEVIYNTNGTFIPDEKVVEELRHYKKVTFILSIDGVGKIAEKVRSGTKWTDILTFISWVYTNNFLLEFNTVLHKNNYTGLEELINFCLAYQAKWYINILTYPKHLDIALLNEKEKNSILELANTYKIPNKDLIINYLRKKTYEI